MLHSKVGEGFDFLEKKHYKCVWFNIISIAKGWWPGGSAHSSGNFCLSNGAEDSKFPLAF